MRPNYFNSKVFLITAMLWVACSAQSQVTLRSEVAKPLQAAQEALTSKDYTSAIAQAKSTLAIPNLTPQERSLIEQIISSAAINAKDYKTAIEPVTYLSSDSTLPISERLTYQETLISLLRTQKDFVNLAKTARSYLDQGGKKDGTRALYVQTLSVLNLHQDVIDYLAPMLKAEPPVILGELELRALAIAFKTLKNDVGYYATLKELVAVSPNKDYWLDLLTKLQKQPFFNPRYELDVYRLMAHNNLLEEADDYLYYAQLALKAGLPAEAQIALNGGISAKVFQSDQEKLNLQKLSQIATRRLSEDEKQIQTLENSAKGQDQAEWAEILFSKADYKGCITKYQSALQTPGLRREPELRLHLLIALTKSGMKTEARNQLNEIKSDLSALELGRLWSKLN